MGWTAITTDTSWQELAIAQEIAEAYNKRVAALTSAEQTAAGVSEISPSESMTVFDFVHTVQTGIEGMARYWGDKDRVLINVSPNMLSFTNFSSVSEMMTAAGLTQSGYWRRIGDGGTQPEDWTSYTAPGWSYGKITDKDLAGPWLFVDLETALSALTRRYSNGIGAIPMAWDGRRVTFYDDAQGSFPNPGVFTWEDGFSAPLYTSYKYMENYASNPVNPDYCFTQIYIEAAYNTCTVTGMSDHVKTVTLYGYYYFSRAAIYADSNVSPAWTPGLGLGYGDLTEGDSLVVALDSYTGSEVSATLYSGPVPQSWAFAANVPWPADLNVHGQSLNDETIIVNCLLPVVDYDFDP